MMVVPTAEIGPTPPLQKQSAKCTLSTPFCWLRHFHYNYKQIATDTPRLRNSLTKLSTERFTPQRGYLHSPVHRKQEARWNQGRDLPEQALIVFFRSRPSTIGRPSRNGDLLQCSLCCINSLVPVRSGSEIYAMRSGLETATVP